MPAATSPIVGFVPSAFASLGLHFFIEPYASVQLFYFIIVSDSEPTANADDYAAQPTGESIMFPLYSIYVCFC